MAACRFLDRRHLLQGGDLHVDRFPILQHSDGGPARIAARSRQGVCQPTTCCAPATQCAARCVSGASLRPAVPRSKSSNGRPTKGYRRCAYQPTPSIASSVTSQIWDSKRSRPALSSAFCHPLPDGCAVGSSRTPRRVALALADSRLVTPVCRPDRERQESRGQSTSFRSESWGGCSSHCGLCPAFAEVEHKKTGLPFE
jgi:hypothetical protein